MEEWSACETQEEGHFGSMRFLHDKMGSETTAGNKKEKLEQPSLVRRKHTWYMRGQCG